MPLTSPGKFSCGKTSSGAELHDQRSFGLAPSWSSKSCNSYDWHACDSPSGCDGARVALHVRPMAPPSTNAEGCPCGGIGMAGAAATAECGVFVGPATAHKNAVGTDGMRTTRSGANGVATAATGKAGETAPIGALGSVGSNVVAAAAADGATALAAGAACTTSCASPIGPPIIGATAGAGATAVIRTRPTTAGITMARAATDGIGAAAKPDAEAIELAAMGAVAATEAADRGVAASVVGSLGQPAEAEAASVMDFCKYACHDSSAVAYLVWPAWSMNENCPGRDVDGTARKPGGGLPPRCAPKGARSAASAGRSAFSRTLPCSSMKRTAHGTPLGPVSAIKATNQDRDVFE
mmetsp:Transcript_55390/g.142611  ORF Transcript_55390/g.142611 Transcript_55390/m.142611 type:complete len:352 (-) Transcript_55390:146-1201(-)